MLTAYNSKLFDEMWNKYASGNYSSWEMAALGMYDHSHELAHVDTKIYDIVPFNSLNAQPQVEKYFKKGNNKISIFKLEKIND